MFDATDTASWERAFGIPICSRYGEQRELGEMRSYCMRLWAVGLSKNVLAVFYDSKAYLCTIWTDGDDQKDGFKSPFVQLAKGVIAQCSINGTHIFSDEFDD